MGAAAYRGKGFKERARVSSGRPIGAASCRQQYNQASCQPPPPPASAQLLIKNADSNFNVNGLCTEENFSK